MRLGELAGLCGAVLLIVSLTQPWYETAAGNRDFWDTFGPAAALLLAALAAALTMLVAALTEREGPALAVASAVWCVLLGLAGVIAAIVRLLERPENASSLCIGPWLALAGTLLIFTGAWQVLRDERPSRYRAANPQPRPRP
jgi:Co/Zn/Cd efflux system component